MKRFYHLLALLLLFVGTATADNFVPSSGTKYLLQCKGNSNFATYNANSTLSSSQATTLGATEGLNVLAAAGNPSANSLFQIEAGTGDYANYFTIRLASDNTKYVYSIVSGGSDANSNVGVKTVSSDETAGSECYWTISTQGEYYNIIPYGINTTLSWNKRGSNNNISQIGMWGGLTQNDNMWSITSADDYMSSIPSPSGYYTIACADGTRAKSIYNDFTLEANAAYDLTLQNTSEVGTTNNYIWYIETTATDNDNLTKTISIKNGQGTPIKVSAQNNYYSGTLNAYSTLTIGWYKTSDQSYYFNEGINGSNFKEDGTTPNYGLSDGTTPHLTTWANQPGAADDRWIFTAVSSDNICAVSVVDGDGNAFTDGYAIYNSEYAKNGGFFSATPSNTSDVTAKEITNYKYAVSINEKTVTVTYTPDYAAIYAEQLATAQALVAKSTASELGYPKSTSTATTALAKFTTNASATSDDVTSIKAAITAYNTETDIVVPEDGTFIYIQSASEDAGNAYLYGDNLSTTIQRSNVDFNPVRFSAEKTSANIFYYSAEKGLVAFSTGYYLTNPSNISTFLAFDGVQTSGSIFSFAKGTSTVAGTCNVLFNNGNRSLYAASSGDNAYADAAGSSAGSDLRYTFSLSYVTEIPVTIGTSGYGTLYTPVALTIPEGTTVYTGKEVSNNVLTLETVSGTIPARSTVLVAGTSGNVVNFTITTSDASAPTSPLVGGVAAITPASGSTYYTLQTIDNESGFAKFNGTVIPGFKGYVLNPTLTLDKNAISLRFPDATGINAINAATENGQSTIYDLQGRRVQNAARGLYIVNGKKVLVK